MFFWLSADPPRVGETLQVKIGRAEVAVTLAGIDETIDLADRVAGLLVVLLAQPFSRICALETHHVVEDGAGLALSIGVDPFPVPDALAILLRRLIDQRPSTATT